MQNTPSMETCLVALTLSGVERLRLAFEASSSATEKQNLLKAAADLMDRTLPMPELTAELKAAAANPVPALIKNRARLAAVPPSLWNKARVAPGDLGRAHYDGIWAVGHALQRDKGMVHVQWAHICAWLAPAWAAYPELKAECQALAPAARETPAGEGVEGCPLESAAQAKPVAIIQQPYRKR